MVIVLMNNLDRDLQSQQLLCESSFGAAVPTLTLAVPTTPSKAPATDSKTEILGPHVPAPRSGIIPLRISIPGNPQAVKRPLRESSGVIFVPALAEVKFEQKVAAVHALDPEVEIVDENGDLVLNFVCTLESWDGIGKTAPFLRLRVSSAVVQDTSEILKLLIEMNIPEEEQQTSMSFQPPRLHGLVTKTDRNSRYLIISNNRIRSNVADALRTLFHILHCKIGDFPLSTKPVLVARVAEVAWLLDCMDSVAPWIRSRLSQLLDPKPSVEALQRAYRSDASLRKMSLGPYENVLLSFVMADQKSFLRASLDYVLLTPPTVHNGRVEPSLGIMAILSEHMQSLIDTTLEKLTSILNNTFHALCVKKASPIAPSTATILGTYVQSVYHVFGKTSFPLELTLGPTESLAHLFKKIREVQLSLTDMWKQVKHIWSNVALEIDNDPGVRFGQEVTEVREGMRGLELERYRPGVSQLMDLSHFLFRGLPA